MTPKEELIQVIERSPDNLIQAMLKLFQVMQSAPQAAAQQRNDQSSNSAYPLRGLPLVIAEDFDEPMSELWEALSE